MLRPSRIPTALTIAGSDSGGGAGIQADLKTFASLGVHGTVAITCVTAQTPNGVLAVQPCRPEMVRRQMEAVFNELRPGAVKTGMLYSSDIVRVIADFFKSGRRAPLIVDPVMIATSGAPLLRTSAVKAIREELLPLAVLVTPNLDETKALIGWKLRSVEDQRRAAREINSRYGCGVLVKGGHWRGLDEAVDIYYDGRTELLLKAPFVRGVSTHGTGCTYSAAVTGYLALGRPLPRAVVLAKEYITCAIAQSRTVCGHSVLNSFWRRRD